MYPETNECSVSSSQCLQVHQQNNNLNMNQNIVNQLNIDLPPPVPGKRSAEQTRAYHHQVTSCVGDVI